MSTRADLAIYQGDDYAAVVTVSNGATPPDQVIAGYTAKAQIREDVADEAEDIKVEIATLVDSPKILLSIPAAQTVDLCDEYVWDLQITAPSGVITTLLNGLVRVTQEVTR